MLHCLYRVNKTNNITEIAFATAPYGGTDDKERIRMQRYQSFKKEFDELFMDWGARHDELKSMRKKQSRWKRHDVARVKQLESNTAPWKPYNCAESELFPAMGRIAKRGGRTCQNRTVKCMSAVVVGSQLRIKQFHENCNYAG
jgi:hypothetical protein